MKFNIQSTLFASLVLLVGTAAAAPVGDEAGDLNVAKRQIGVIADAGGNPIATYIPTVTPAVAAPVVNEPYRRT